MILKAYLIAAYFLLIGYHVRVRREMLGNKIHRVYVHLGTCPVTEPVTVSIERRTIDVLSLVDHSYTKIIPAIHGAHMEVDAV
jgi:hypothetical protein